MLSKPQDAEPLTECREPAPRLSPYSSALNATKRDMHDARGPMMNAMFRLHLNEANHT